MNYKPHYSVHQKAHIALTPENSHQKHVVLVPFNDNEALMDRCGLRWGEVVKLRLEDGVSGRNFRGSKINWTMLLGMRKEIIPSKIRRICTVNRNEMKGII
jgi:hypothetical protein